MRVLLKAAQQPQDHFYLCFTKTLPGNVLSFLPVRYDSRKEKKERLRLRVTSVEKVGAHQTQSIPRVLSRPLDPTMQKA